MTISLQVGATCNLVFPPALLIMSILGFVLSVLVLFSIKFSLTRFVYIPTMIWIALYVLSVLIWPSVTQRLSVTPNEYVKEKEYISYNIDFTRKAYLWYWLLRT